jgi:hypothetical protein
MKPPYRPFLLAGTCSVWIILFGFAPGRAAEKPAVGLTFEAAGREYRFNTGVLSGTLRSGGRSLGIGPVQDITSDTVLSRGMGLLSSYRLLTADARFGTAAWDWPSQAHRRSDGTVEVHWIADNAHPLEMTAIYRLAAPNIIDVHMTVKPQQNLRRFELFLASYFQGFPASFVYAKDERGKAAFVEATKDAGLWQTFPRDDESARLFSDGRWQRPPSPVTWKIRASLTAPLALRRDAKSGLTAVLMASAQDCFAVSTPYGEESHRSVYFSLFGCDMKSGQSATARSRLVMGRSLSDQQAVDLYRAFTSALK